MRAVCVRARVTGKAGWCLHVTKTAVVGEKLKFPNFSISKKTLFRIENLRGRARVCQYCA